MDEKTYWGYEYPVASNPAEAIEQFRELFLDSVRIRLRSDVKVGCLLSGGLDSSAITLACQGYMGNQLETYSVVSSDHKFSEERFIDKLTQSHGIAIVSLCSSRHSRSRLCKRSFTIVTSP